ncbi:MAG TPA: restriction endonuclease subunit S [Syntrophaceae bacterium]|nr:restriction endonuclease subunit S [Syntrophaceae bacterium]
MKEHNLKQTEIGKIPKEWKVVRLGRILSLRNGERPLITENSIFPIYGANGIMGYTSNFLVNNDFTIIIGRVGASGEIHLATGKIWISDNAIYSRHYDKDKVYMPFVSYLLKFKNINRFATKSTHPIITQSFLNSFLVPLPPLPEQQKIAEILSTVDQAIEKVDESIAKTERLKKGLMQELLTKGIGHKEFKDTEIGRIPKEWEVVKINQISEVRRGASPRPIGNQKYFSEKGRGWIRISDVTNTYKYLRSTSQYLSKLGESKSVEVNPGDLIMSICATIGKPIIVDMKACIHDGFVVFRNLSKVINIEFLFYVLQRNEYKFVNMKQTGTQGNLNTTLVGETFIPLPPLPEQQKIAEVLSTVDKRLELLRNKKEKLHRIKKGLMNDLLIGRRRVKV